MTRQEQRDFFHDFARRQLEILMKKGDDYAGEDRLSNFKLVGQVCRMKPELQCLSMIVTKATRLGELFSGTEPKNESIEDSVIDMANFAVLLAMILNESSNALRNTNDKTSKRMDSRGENFERDLADRRMD